MSSRPLAPANSAAVSATPKLSAVWHVSVGAKEVIHEVHVANEDGVPEGGVHRVGLSAADQRHPVTASEVPHLVAAGVDWAGAEGRDGAPEAVEDMDRKLLA